MLNHARVCAAIICVLAAVPLLAVNNPPTLLSISPLTVIAGSSGFTMTATGQGFITGAHLLYNNTQRVTTVVSSTQLTAAIAASDILTATTVPIKIANPDGQTSSPLTFTILPNNPTIGSLSPSTLPVGTTSLSVTISGQNFGSDATALVNNTTRTTAYVDSTQLTMTLNASDVASAGTLSVKVVQSPNSKVSNTVSLTISAATPPPSITLLNPNTVAAGSAGFTLSIVGTNFVGGSSVRINGTPRNTTFVDSSHLTIQLTSTDIAVPATLNVSVVNPDGQSSSSLPLTVTATAVPTINSISPTTVTVGAQPFTLTISGTNFVTGTTVTIGSSINRAATFVSSTTLTFTVQTADVNAVGQVPISVTTPQPKVATSNQVILYVVATNAPNISSITPSSVQAGSPDFNMLVNGSNFLFDDAVQVSGSPVTTQFLSATQLAAVVPAAMIASAGTLNVTVARHDGSAISAPVQLTVTSTTGPSIGGFNPAQGSVGDQQLALAVLGHNYVSGSVVTFDNTVRTTQYVSATELDINLTASDLASARGIPVQVTNPDGSTSNVLLFYVVAPVPTIASLSPSSVISGDSGFQLTVSGTNFSSDSVINVNGTALATQIQTSTGALQANVDAALISAPGTLSVTVTRNGVASAPASLVVLRPTITAVNPAVIVIGTGDTVLNVQGSAFLTTSTVIFLGSPLTTVYNATDGSLSATIPSGTLTDPGQYAVSVRNSANSVSIPFLIEVQGAGTPRIDSIQPSTIAVGSGITSIQIAGGNFVPASVVQVNGTARTTTYVAGNVLKATLLSSDISAPATLHVTVVNPGGATSAEGLVTVTGTTQAPSKRRAVRH